MPEIIRAEDVDLRMPIPSSAFNPPSSVRVYGKDVPLEVERGYCTYTIKRGFLGPRVTIRKPDTHDGIIRSVRLEYPGNSNGWVEEYVSRFKREFCCQDGTRKEFVPELAAS